MKYEARFSRRAFIPGKVLLRTYRTGRDARPEVPGTGRLRQRDASECARRPLLRSVRRADERHRYSAKPRHPRVDTGITRHAVTPPPDHRVRGIASRGVASEVQRAMNGERITRRLGVAAWKQRRTKVPRRIDRRLDRQRRHLDDDGSSLAEAAGARTHTHTRAQREPPAGPPVAAGDAAAISRGFRNSRDC